MSLKSFSNLFGMRPLPEISYIICATPRCGSTFLGETLMRTRLAGIPWDHFIAWYWATLEPERLQQDFMRPWLLSTKAYIEKVFREGATPNGVFGTKMMRRRLDIVVDKLKTLAEVHRPLSAAETLAAVFLNLRYIHITRQDKIRQAVSQARAIQSDLWFELEAWYFEEPRADKKYLAQIKANMEKAAQVKLVYDFHQIKSAYDERRR